MANETWNETGANPAAPGWRPAYGTEPGGRDEALIDVERTDQDLDLSTSGDGHDRGYGADMGAGPDTGALEGRRLAREDQRRIAATRPARPRHLEQRVDYPDKAQRNAEWDDRKAAYEREAEERRLLTREHEREVHESKEQRQARKDREREEAQREEERNRRMPRSGIDHSASRQSTGTLLRDFVAEAQLLASEEIRMAKAELRDEAKLAAKNAGKGAGGLGIGGVMAFVGLLALTATVIVALAALMPLWLSAFIVGGLMLLVGGILAMGGLSKLKQIAAPKPDETTETLKEDREWASEMMRGVRSKRRAHV